MTKTDFVIEARKLGIHEKMIDDHYKAFTLLVNEIPQVTIQEYLKNAIEAQANGDKFRATGEYPLGSWWFEEFLKKRQAGGK